MDVNNGDSEDWPENWKEIHDIDALLRCSICCEYMDTAMILAKCSHSYCSLCIRRSLCYKTQCPTCFVPATDGDMINNRSLNEIIQKFTLIRKRLLESLRSNCIVGKDTSPATNTSHIQKKTPSFPKVQNKTSVEEKRNLEPKTFFEKGKSPIIKSSSKSHLKLDTSLEQTNPKYGLRKSSSKQYILSDDSDTRDSDSDSDVIICGEEASDSSDEDFESKAPLGKGKRGTGTFKNAATKLSDRLIPRLEGSSGSYSGTDSHSTEGLSSPSEKSTNEFNFKASTVFDSRIASPLRLPSLKISHPLPASTPQKQETPSTSTSTPGTSSGVKTIKRVPCPVCGVEVPDKHINLHLDRCLSNKDRPQTRVAPKRKLMPKLVYNLLSDKELKKKCSDVGLNSQGDRKALIKRHHEFTLLYNAECDSVKPKSAAEIIRQVERTERAKTNGLQMKSSSTIVNKLVIQKGASTDQVEQAQKEYVKQHKSQFAQLIEEARKRRMKKQQEKAAEGADKERQAEADQPQPSDTDTTGTGATDITAAEPTESVSLTNTNNNASGDLPEDVTVSAPIVSVLPSLPKQPITPEMNMTIISSVPAADSLEKQTLYPVPLPQACLQETTTNPPDERSISNRSALVDSRPNHIEVEEMETQFIEDDGDGISDADLVRGLNETLEARGGGTDPDETLPLEDSQMDTASDDDLFDSPPSPSLLEPPSDVTRLEEAATTVEYVEDERAPALLDSSTNLQEDAETKGPDTGGDHMVQTNSFVTESDPGAEQPQSEIKETRRRGRPKKESKRVSSQNVAQTGASVDASYHDVPQFNLGWADVLGTEEEHQGHVNKVPREETSESFSETASVGTSFSGASGSFADSDPLREDHSEIPADVPQPRRSGRARQKRRLSGSVDQVAPPAGKRSRRNERKTETTTEPREIGEKPTEQVMEPTGEEGGRKGQRRRKKY